MSIGNSGSVGRGKGFITDHMIEMAKQRVRDANDGYLVTPVYNKEETDMSDPNGEGMSTESMEKGV